MARGEGERAGCAVVGAGKPGVRGRRTEARGSQRRKGALHPSRAEVNSGGVPWLPANRRPPPAAWGGGRRDMGL